MTALLQIAPLWWWIAYAGGVLVVGFLCWQIREKKP